MKLRTIEKANVFAEYEYDIDENKITKEELKILKEKKDLKKIQDILDKYVFDIHLEQISQPYDFVVEEIIE